MGLFSFGKKKKTERFPNTLWFCDRCNSSLSIQDGFSDYKKTWKCSECGYVNDISSDNILEGEYEYIYSNTKYSDDVKMVEPNFGETYDDVYDEDGYFVYCDNCNNELKWKDGAYICPNCGQTMSRAEFFNYIGAEPPGPNCITCVELYPGCVFCPYGYIDDDD